MIKKILLSLIISLVVLSVIGISNSYASSAKIIVCLNDPTLCPNTNFTINFPISSGSTPTLHFSDCANNQIQKYQSSNSTWICSNDNTGGGLTSINSDTTAAQLLNGQTGNITITTSSGTTTFKLGISIPILGGASQIFTKAISFSAGNKLTLTPSASTSGLNLVTSASDLTSPRQGDLRIVGTSLKYNDNSNGTQTLTPSSYLTTAVTSATGTSRNITVSASTGAVTWNLGDLVVVTNGNLQNFTSGKKIQTTSSSSTSGFNLGSLASDLTSPRRGDLRIIGSSLKYNDNTNTTQTITPSSYLTSAITSINSNNAASQTLQGENTNVTVSDSGATHTFKLGTNIPVLSGAAQRFSNTLTIQDPIINGLDIARVDKSVAYTATVFDNVINVNVTACGSPCQITLPTASSDTNGTYWIKKVDFGRNILSIKGGGSIDGFTWFNMTNAKDAVQLQSNSTGWNVLESSALDFNAYHVKGTVNNRWYGTETIEATNATFSGTAGHLYATQLILPKPVKIDQIRIGVTTLGASSLCRVGIYSDNGTAYPNSIVSGSDVGTLTTSTLGIKSNTFTGSGITLNGGLYWLAMNCQATMPSLAGVTAGSFDSVLGMGNARMGGQQIGTGYDATLAFGALPTAYPSGAAITIAGTEPMIQIRIIG